MMNTVWNHLCDIFNHKNNTLYYLSIHMYVVQGENHSQETMLSNFSRVSISGEEEWEDTMGASTVSVMLCYL